MEQATAKVPALARKSSTLFEGDPVEEAEVAQIEETDARREHDRRVDLLITPKGHQRLRAFGFEVVHTGKASLAPSTSDRRSL